MDLDPASLWLSCPCFYATPKTPFKKYKLSVHQYDNYSHALNMYLKTIDLSGGYLMISSGEKDSEQSLVTTYIKIVNFRTIKLSDKILSESLFVRTLVLSEIFCPKVLNSLKLEKIRKCNIKC